MCSFRLFAAIAAALLLCVPPVFAKDKKPAPPVPTISGDASQYTGWSVSKVKVEGVPKGVAEPIKKGLQLSQKKLFRGGPPLSKKVLDADLARATLYLSRNGYPRARIATDFVPGSKEKVQLVLRIEPGPVVFVNEVSTTGFPPGMDKKIHDAVLVRPKRRFSDDDVQVSAGSLTDILKRAGHAEALIRTRIVQQPADSVAVRFEADPGNVYWFRRLQVERLEHDMVPLARKTIHIRRGMRYTPARIETAQDRLQLLQLFSQTNFRTVPVEPDSIDVFAEVLLRRPQVVEVGAGYMTDDLASAHAAWTHRNLLGAGRGIQTSAAVSRYTRNLSVAGRWPDFFGPSTHGDAQVQLNRDDEKAYRETDTQLNLAATYTPSVRLTAQSGIAVTNVDLRVKTVLPATFQGVHSGLLTYVFLHWDRNATDNRLAPSRGFVASARSEFAPSGFFTDNHYVLGDGSFSIYVPYRGMVAAGRIELGAAAPIGSSTELLPSKRFYAGGVKSMRGFRRRQLGPLDPEGAAVGGQALYLGSAEIRIPIVWRLIGAIFLDSGQVWPRVGDFSTRRVEMAAGPGLMIQTPVGPIRADLARRLTHYEKGQPNTVLQLSIGEPF